MRFFVLPPAILLSICNTAEAINGTNPQLPSANNSLLVSPKLSDQWPYHLPPHIKYWPDTPLSTNASLKEQSGQRNRIYGRDAHETIDKRWDEVKKRMEGGEVPNVVRKMRASDPGQKFWGEYWSFDDNYEIQRREVVKQEVSSQQDRPFGNSHTTSELHAPFNLHFDLDKSPSSQYDLSRRGLAPLRRDDILPEVFRRGACPVGTNPCIALGNPNLCCETGQTCITITDTGLGPVGCCATGNTCSGRITSCLAGNTACPSSLGGGCCIPGYVCSGVGCVNNVIVTITSIVTVTTGSSTTVVTTTVVTSTTPLTDTSLQTTSVCAAGAKPCPINIGGGCCPTDRICTTGLLCPLSSPTTSITTTTIPTPTPTQIPTSTVPDAPVRPTNGPSTITLTAPTTLPLPSQGPSICPNGFYQCSAYYAGGCCQVDRDCQTHDCPATASITLTSNGATIVVPVTSAATTFATPICANGWAACAADQGGDCCPVGWVCGSGSCTSVGIGDGGATATAVRGKEGVGIANGAAGGMRAAASIVGTLFGGLWVGVLVVARMGGW